MRLRSETYCYSHTCARRASSPVACRKEILSAGYGEQQTASFTSQWKMVGCVLARLMRCGPLTAPCGCSYVGCGEDRSVSICGSVGDGGCGMVTDAVQALSRHCTSRISSAVSSILSTLTSGLRPSLAKAGMLLHSPDARGCSLPR